MKSRTLATLIGPRIPRSGNGVAGRYLVPTILLVLAGVLLLVSIFQPYWRMTLHAPQYPKGLTVRAYLNRLEGDVFEIDGLNHYIGMRPLGEAAQLERTLSIMAVVALALLVVAAVYIHNRRAALLALPAAVFPAGFLADLFYWLHSFGHSLDPKAALSAAIRPFTPPVLGVGRIGQFKTLAVPDVGLILAFAASALILAGLWFHRRAYKPLVDEAASRRTALAACVVALGLSTEIRAYDLQAAIEAAAPGETITI